MKKTMIILVAMLIALTGCQKATMTNVTDFAGVYALVSVDGISVPATVSHDGHDLKVYSGIFTINPGGTCSSKILFGPLSGEKGTRKVNATYTRKGSTLNMQWIGAGRTVGTIKDNTFTMNNHGMIFSYKKETEKTTLNKEQ